jgi:hypothetical protein
MMKRLLYSLTLFFLQATTVWAETAAGTKIDVFPPVPYDQAWVYMNLGFLWAGIIGLVILLRMKLREIERTQKMEREEAERAAPLLE